MKINILGYGVMGKQIVSLFCIGGFDIVVWNNEYIKENELYRNVRLARKLFPSNVEGSIRIADTLEELEDNFTIEAVKEDLAIKKYVNGVLKSKISKGYFSNTSSFSPHEIGDEVNGLHFFNPISIKLVEVFLSKKFTSSQEYNSVVEYLVSQQFSIVKVNANRGYIGNYVLFNEISTIFRLIEIYKYSYKDICTIYKILYNGRDLFQIIDLIGVDVVFQILKNLKKVDVFIYVPNILSLALKQGILGRKNKTSILDVLDNGKISLPIKNLL